MNDYKVKVVEFPQKRLVGMKVGTTMSKAQVDCPAIWQTFGPRIDEIVSGDCPGSYGLSLMLNEQDFDYWAAVESDLADPLPSGLARVEIPAGWYARAEVPNLEGLGPAYMYLYDQWLKESGNTANYQAAGFEFYPPNWQPAEALEIFMPLIKT